jgi:ABC-type glycerol-3-phosphate transport system permease component
MKAIHASWAWDQYLLSLAVVTSPTKLTVRSALSSLKEIEVAIRAPFRANGA